MIAPNPLLEAPAKVCKPCVDFMCFLFFAYDKCPSSDEPIAMALSVKADETALELFRRSNRSPLRTGIAFLDEVMTILLLYPRTLLLELWEIFPLFPYYWTRTRSLKLLPDPCGCFAMHALHASL